MASFSFFASINLVTGMPYSAQMVLASVSRSAFLPSFLAWLMIFWVWFKCCSSFGVCMWCFWGLKMVCLWVVLSACVYVEHVNTTV